MFNNAGISRRRFLKFLYHVTLYSYLTRTQFQASATVRVQVIAQQKVPTKCPIGFSITFPETKYF